ncbi:hypothetical protein D3C81_1411330 [compost metagenome]
MHPLHRVVGVERQRAGKHLVQRHTKGIQIAARIDRTIHSTGLFRRHVGQGPGNGFWRRGGLTFARQSRGQTEPHQPGLSVVAVDKDVLRFEILVHQPAQVQTAKRYGYVDCVQQAGFSVQRRDQQTRQRLAAGVVE